MVQEKAVGDVCGVHVGVHVLSRSAALGAIPQLQEIPKGSLDEVSLVYTGGSLQNSQTSPQISLGFPRRLRQLLNACSFVLTSSETKSHEQSTKSIASRVSL